MGPVWVLVVLLLSQGVEGYCDVRQNNAQCYGALGGTIQIRLMDTASEENRCMWKKKTTTIFEWKNNCINKNALEDRSVFTRSNGTFQINNLTRNDNDTYNLDFYDSNGIIIKKLTYELLIQAPVSSVLLELECLFKGEVRATCTAPGGDSPEYIWTLNGQNIADSPMISKHAENSITLRQEGVLGCYVKNHISQVHEEKNISTCGYIFIYCTSPNGTNMSDWVYAANNTLCIQPTTVSTRTTPLSKTTSYINASTHQSTQATFWDINYLPAIIGAFALIVLIVGVGLICVLKKRCKKDKDEGHEQDLTYADVRILQQPQRRPPQTTEGEVEYGQVKFSNQSQHSYVEDNACIYAKVHR